MCKATYCICKIKQTARPVHNDIKIINIKTFIKERG